MRVPEPMLACGDVGIGGVAALFAPAGLRVLRVPPGTAIPGSHWGEPEAGLVGAALHVRDDTPVHSALHEGGHWLLMGAARRATVHTDAGGCADEENAVCLLQLVLADALPPMDFARLVDDMDAWGYSFRLGSTRAWYEGDADDARRALAARIDRFVLAPAVMGRVRSEVDHGPHRG